MRKKYRLKDNREISRILKNKQSFFGSTINYYYKRNNHPVPKFAIITSKKKFPLAVQRNRIKRQIRAIISNIVPNLKNYNIVIIVKSNWTSNCFLKNKQAIETAFKRLMKEARYGE